MTLFTQLVAVLLSHTVSASSTALAEPAALFQLAASQEPAATNETAHQPLRTCQFASGSTDSRMPTDCSTASRVLRVGFPLGESER